MLQCWYDHIQGDVGLFSLPLVYLANTFVQSNILFLERIGGLKGPNLDLKW